MEQAGLLPAVTPSVLVPGLVGLVTAALVLYHLFLKPRLPPGPGGLPIVGSMLQFTAQNRDDLLNAWTAKYGPVLTVWIGTMPNIFVSGRAEVKEFLFGAGGRFDSRPQRRSRHLLTNRHRTINTSLYGPRWKELRKNLMMNALSHSRLAGMAPFRAMKIEALVETLRKHCEESPEATVPVLQHIRFLGFTLLLYISFGKELEDEKVRAIDKICNKMFALAGPNIGDYIPLVHLLVNKKHYEKCTQARNTLIEIVLPIITEIRLARKAGTPILGSYADSLAAEAEKGLLDLDDSDYISLCSELLNGGTDTTANAMQFALAEMVNGKAQQAKLAAEIRSVCGDRPVAQSDLESLPYLKAVVLETLRLHPPGNFTLAHQTTQKERLGGYDIPKNAELMACLHKLSTDPEVWPKPLAFMPERFLEGPPIDITGTKGPITMIPFGAGRRICPGMNLAMLHMQLILGRLVQAFEWLPPKGKEFVDITHGQIFTVTMKYPLEARVRLREAAAA